MYQALIQGLGQIEEARFDIAPIALIVGLNNQGKSTIATGIAAALTGIATVRDVAKKDATLLVRGGRASATATVSGEHGQVGITWPSCEATSAGDVVPKASPIAAGLVRVMAMPAADRARVLIDAMGALPDEAMFTKAMIESGIKAKGAQQLWEQIQEKGWDATLRARKEAATKAKGRWEGVTESRYGKDKAESWQPPHWREDLRALSRETLQAVVTAARAQVERAQAQAAVDGAKIKELEAKFESAKQAAESLVQATTALNAARLRRDEAQQALDRAQSVECNCPECGAIVRIVGDHLEKAADVAQDRHTAEQLRALKAMLKKAEEVFEAAAAQEREAQAAIVVGNRAHTEIEALRAKLARDKGTGEALEQARMGLNQAERDLDAFVSYEEATNIQRVIRANQAVIALLEPEGLRKRKIADSIPRFNERVLEPLGRSLGLESLHLDNELNLRIGAWPYPLCAESLQWRADVALQIAVAQADGSSMVVIDRADVLDNPGRKALLLTLKMAKMPAVICMTASDPANVPDLAKAGLGGTYWVENNRTCPVAAKLAERAAA